jgi:hypothetical protein
MDIRQIRTYYTGARPNKEINMRLGGDSVLGHFFKVVPVLVQLHLQLGGNRGGNAGGNGITCTLVLIRKAGTDNFRFLVLYFPTS